MFTNQEYAEHMFDAHCHLESERFDQDRNAVLGRGRAIGIKGWLVAGIGPDGWNRQAALNGIPDVHVAFGIHPLVAAELSELQLQNALVLLTKRHGIGLGEMGLDTRSRLGKETLPRQLAAFRAQLALAREVNLPIILHVVGSHGLALQTLAKDGVPTAGGMLHSYSGSPEMVSQYEALGLYISFSGSISRPKARRPVMSAAAVSDDRLLVETDCPDQRPHERKGDRNLPEYLSDVVGHVAQARGTSFSVVAQQTRHNACRLFGL
jgi:TatD DNase family protein